MPMMMPPQDEAQALQAALGDGNAPPEADPETQELQILMQLIEQLKQTGDPKVMALLEQLMALQQPPGPPEGVAGDV